MAEPQHNGGGNGITVHTPGGFWATLSGRDIALMVLIIAQLLLQIYYADMRGKEHDAIIVLIQTVTAERRGSQVEIRDLLTSTRRENYDGLAYQNVLLRTICRGITPLQQQRLCEPAYRGYNEVIPDEIKKQFQQELGK